MSFSSPTLVPGTGRTTAGPGPRASRTRLPGPAGRRLFERGWSTKPAGAAGRGMGLWLTRRIAEEAGGVAEVATDSGTVFTVEVPPAAEPEAGTA